MESWQLPGFFIWGIMQPVLSLSNIWPRTIQDYVKHSAEGCLPVVAQM